MEIIPKSIFLCKLTEFVQFTELAILKIPTGEVNGTFIVGYLTFTAAMNLQPKPYHRMVIEIEIFGSSFYMPARLDVSFVMQDKSCVPRAHKDFCSGSQAVFAHNRQTTSGSKGTTAAGTERVLAHIEWDFRRSADIFCSVFWHFGGDEESLVTSIFHVMQGEIQCITKRIKEKNEACAHP